MTRARPDLPAHHPQNVPLDQWSEGWLKLSVACHFPDHHFIILHDWEKAEKGLPVTREELIAFLVSKDEIPAAGLSANPPA